MTNNIRKRKLNSKLGRCLVTFGTLIGAGSAFAAEEGVQVQNASETEVMIRQQRGLDIKELIADAETDIGSKDYSNAAVKLLKAFNLLKKNSTTNKALIAQQEKVKHRLSDVYILEAEKLFNQGVKEGSLEALKQSNKALQSAVSFDTTKSTRAEHLAAEIAKVTDVLTYEEAVDRKSLEEKFAEDDKEIDILLDKAKIYMSLSKYSDAREACEEVLIKDAFNVEAARLMTRINEKLYDFAEERREMTVLERTSEVNWKWSEPVSIATSSNVVLVESKKEDSLSSGEIYDQLSLVIPKIKFVDSDIAPIVAYIKRRAKKLDKENRALNIILQLDQETAESKKISIEFDDIPVNDLLRYICKSANLNFKIENEAVVIAESGKAFSAFEQRFFPVQAGLLDTLSEIDSESVTDEDQEGNSEEFELKNFFIELGVPFPTGSNIKYVPSISRLAVKNTADNLRKLQEVLQQLNIQPSQVVIETKFVEISEGNVNELGFGWTIQDGGYNNLGGDRLQIGGNINQGGLTGRDGSAVGATQTIDGVTTNRLNADASANLRTANSIGALGTIDTSQIPGDGSGNLAVTGSIGNIDFDMLIRNYEQKTFQDVLNAPKVTTLSGQTATLRVVDERYFPEEWEEPEIAPAAGGNGVNLPSHPTFGEPRDVGVSLVVTPIVDADGYTIELDMTPEVLEFLGYDESFNLLIENSIISGIDDGNYLADTPVPTTLQGLLDTGYNDGVFEVDEQTVFTNPSTIYRVEMPIFSSRTVETKAMIWDGETVILGGLVRERVNRFSDKIPVLGDLPFIGKIFSSRGENRVKTNLLIMLSARLINPAGNPVRPMDLKGIPDFNRL